MGGRPILNLKPLQAQDPTEKYHEIRNPATDNLCWNKALHIPIQGCKGFWRGVRGDLAVDAAESTLRTAAI